MAGCKNSFMASASENKILLEFYQSSETEGGLRIVRGSAVKSLGWDIYIG